MEIKVTFRFDASESLLICVDNFRKAAEAIAESGLLAHLPVSKESGIVKAVATEDGVTMNKKERIWPPVETTQAEAQPEPEPEPETPRVPTVADMRAAVSRCRARIEGEDWEGKASDGYKLYHKKVTAAVKGILVFLDAEKIPDVAEEKRASFIEQVDHLMLDGDSVQSDLPF